MLILKPTANTSPKSKEVAREYFEQRGFTIIREGAISAKEIRSRGLIEKHYSVLFGSAARIEPADLVVSKTSQGVFHKQFGRSWDEVLQHELVFNAQEFCERFGVEEGNLYQNIWRRGRDEGPGQVKLCASTKCVQISADKFPQLGLPSEEVYLVNGQWYRWRNTWHNAPNGVHYFVISWSKDQYTYEAFRKHLIGPTDPSKATDPTGKFRDCLRLKFLNEWRECGLAERGIASPELNAIDASKSPFQSLSEQMNWLGLDPKHDPTGFGQRVISCIGEEKLNEWRYGPLFRLKDGSKMRVFDYLHLTNLDECLDRLERMARGMAVAYESAFNGNILEKRNCKCVVSWPGIYAMEWDAMVQRAKDDGVSAAVVFLPEGTAMYGQHGSDACYCKAMYGSVKAWGCKWVSGL